MKIAVSTSLAALSCPHCSLILIGGNMNDQSSTEELLATLQELVLQARQLQWTFRDGETNSVLCEQEADAFWNACIGVDEALDALAARLEAAERDRRICIETQEANQQTYWDQTEYLERRLGAAERLRDTFFQLLQAEVGAPKSDAEREVERLNGEVERLREALREVVRAGHVGIEALSREAFLAKRALED